MKIGIVTAMSSERALMEECLRNVRHVRLPLSGRESAPPSPGGNAIREYRLGRIGPHEVVLAETGIGKVNAALGAAALLREWTPDCLLSTGVAGGIDPSLRVMDVVAASEVAYHDVDCGPGNAPGQVQGMPPRFAADPRLLEVARAMAGAERRLAVGLLASGDRFVSGPAQRDAVLAVVPGALAVEMESGALAQTCHLLGCPFLSLRTISDTPNAEGNFAQYGDFWKDMARRSFDTTRAFLEALPETLG